MWRFAAWVGHGRAARGQDAAAPMIRRAITLVLCALAFWSGIKLERSLTGIRCENAGGVPNAQNICTGVPQI
ncbi:MAG: hypothetical protein JXR14_00505 [Paracoccaceae bacterium]